MKTNDMIVFLEANILSELEGKLPEPNTYDGRHQGNQMEAFAHNELLEEVKQTIESMRGRA